MVSKVAPESEFRQCYISGYALAVCFFPCGDLSLTVAIPNVSTTIYPQVTHADTTGILVHNALKARVEALSLLLKQLEGLADT